MPIYLKYPGCDGSVTTKDYEKWIELESCQLGASRPMESRVGNDSYATSGKLHMTEVTCTKLTDTSTPKLEIEAIQGRFDKKINIAFVTTTGDSTAKYLNIDLTDTGISAFSISGDKDRHPGEMFSLSFSKFEFTFFGMDKAGKPDPKRGGYDLAQAKSL